MTQENRSAALVLGVIALAGPRRTRPLAAFLYGAAISRAHGAARDRMWREANVHINATLERLFSEKTSVGARVDRLEAILRAQYGGRSLEEIEGIATDAIRGGSDV